MADADVIVVGAGLAGLVAAAEVADAGHRVIIVEHRQANQIADPHLLGKAVRHFRFRRIVLVGALVRRGSLLLGAKRTCQRNHQQSRKQI
jgi:predicted oxidoreductase